MNQHVPDIVPSSRAICVAGWHFPPEFYRAAIAIPDTTVFVVSHKPAEDVPLEIRELLPERHILIRPNEGYDWGCYQQFLDTGLWRSFESIAFMHDDVVILRPDFFEAAAAHFTQGAKVVGNGRNDVATDWLRKYPGYYAHATWPLPGPDFVHDTVRGSFFVTTREVLDRLGSFEVFWDPRRWTDQFGNWSLRATSAKIQHLFGPQAFAFLSDEYLKSDYIQEGLRGEYDNDASRVHWPGLWYHAYIRLMHLHMRCQLSSSRLLKSLSRSVAAPLLQLAHRR